MGIHSSRYVRPRSPILKNMIWIGWVWDYKSGMARFSWIWTMFLRPNMSELWANDDGNR